MYFKIYGLYFSAFQVSDKQQLIKAFQKGVKVWESGGCEKPCFGARQICRERDYKKGNDVVFNAELLVAQAASGGLYRLPEWRNAEKSESYPEAFAPQTTR